MSKNYIKVLLEPFRESKVLGSLLRWFEPASGNSGKGKQGSENEVRHFYSYLYLYFFEVS